MTATASSGLGGKRRAPPRSAKVKAHVLDAENRVHLNLNETFGAYHLLGGADIFADVVKNSLEAHDEIMKGFSADALIHLVESVSVLSTGDALAKAIGMSLRTFQRKKASSKVDRLSTEQSSRAWQFAEILAQAISVLGDQETAENWMLEPAFGLDNRRPIDLLSTTAGAEAVENYLTRLEYGVYT